MLHETIPCGVVPVPTGSHRQPSGSDVMVAPCGGHLKMVLMVAPCDGHLKMVLMVAPCDGHLKMVHPFVPYGSMNSPTPFLSVFWHHAAEYGCT